MKKIFTIMLMSIIMTFSAACKPVEDAVGSAAKETPTVSLDIVEQEAADKVSVATCPEATTGTHLLTYAAQGVCFLYPDDFDVWQGDGGTAITIYTKSVLNTEAPLASLSFEPANGRSLEEVTAQRLADFAFPDTVAQAITLGGQPASMLDNLPGQDTNRRVVAINNDMVYDLMVARTGADYGVVGEQAEALYDTLTTSFQFIGLEPNAPLIAGPECPEPAVNSTLYKNEVVGYCLLLPAEYSILEVNPEATDNEIAFYIDSLQDPSHARFSIKVSEANGRSLEEITTAYENEIETAVPGYDVLWSFGLMLDGAFANQFDQVPGQDLSRQVLMVHNGRLFNLTFSPDDPDAAEAYEEMQKLYEMVMATFSFLWQK